jgi:hypothetical protein
MVVSRGVTRVSPNAPSTKPCTTYDSAKPPHWVAVWLMPSSTASGSSSIDTNHGPDERR